MFLYQKKIIMKILVLLFIVCSSKFAMAQNVSATTNTEELCSLQHKNPKHRFAFSVQTFQLEDKTWGYNILADKKILFHQATMPGKQNTGFSTSVDALKVGENVANKLANPVAAPLVSVRELQEMGIK